MPAIILPFERRHPSSRGAACRAAVAAPPPAVRPITSRQIAHRWAMLSHLRRHFPPKDRPGEPPDPVR